ncbi:hypothetical protein [Zoogloea sp.]|uniref:hypothetical protein n=1 Tax=Zoogloea sp. TaxID=49181 RepID=UPI002589DC05|nr:hypothetical protein [Zoogloea sp.]MDD2669414.1 hypothetical protein [Zoogloea sp.]
MVAFINGQHIHRTPPLYRQHNQPELTSLVDNPQMIGQERQETTPVGDPQNRISVLGTQAKGLLLLDGNVRQQTAKTPAEPDQRRQNVEFQPINHGPLAKQTLLADCDQPLDSHERKFRHRAGQIALRPTRSKRCWPGRGETPLGNPRQFPAKRTQGRPDNTVPAFSGQIEALTQGRSQLIRPDNPAKRPNRRLFALPQTITKEQARQRVLIQDLAGMTRQARCRRVHAR